MKKIKNNDTISHTWCGQEIEPNEYYQIQNAEQIHWANDAILLVDIANAIAIVNDGSSDITDINIAIDFLKNDIPQNVIIQSQPAVQINSNPPFAEPTYRTKRNATPTLISIDPDTYQNIDFYMTAERYVAGGLIIIENAVFGDYLTAEVTDIDGVIPEPYRAALCENWPTVALYVEKAWIPASGDIMTKMEMDTYPLNAKITAGLYLRITYHTIDSGSTRRVAVNYYLTKKL